MEGTRTRVEGLLKSPNLPVYSLGWFRLEMDMYWDDDDEELGELGQDDEGDTEEPDYIFDSHGTYFTMDFSIDEKESDEEAESRFASQIYEYTVARVYEIGCDQIEIIPEDDTPERFIYFGD